MNLMAMCCGHRAPCAYMIANHFHWGCYTARGGRGPWRFAGSLAKLWLNSDAGLGKLPSGIATAVVRRLLPPSPSDCETFLSEPVQYFVQGKSAWRAGFRGLLLRKRALWATALIALFTMGVPWWWTALVSPLPERVTLRMSYAITLAAFSVGLSATVVLYFLRRSSIRRSKVGHELHELAHYLRDAQTRVLNGRASGKSSHLAAGSEGLHLFADGACERVKDLFQSLTVDESVEAAVRLAVLEDSQSAGNSVVYATVGRSSGLSSDRRFTTQALSANKGVARFLAEEHRSRGVLLYRDIRGAARVHAYELTPNDDTYRDEIKTMMVVPLNAWDGKQRCMIGILYVASKRASTFKGDYVDYVRFAADTVALALTDLVESLQPVGSGT